MTRVLVVEVGDGLWGAQRYLLRLAPLLRMRDFDTVLVAPLDSAMAAAWLDAGYRAIGFDTPVKRSIRAEDGRLALRLVAGEILRSLRNGIRLARIARRQRFDVIHGNSHWNHLDAALAGLFARRPVVLHLHEEVEPGIPTLMRGLVVRLATNSIAVSDAVGRQLPSWARRQVVTVRNGVDLTRFVPGPADPTIRAQLTADPEAPVALVMSRLDPKKGVDVAIRAVATANEGARRPIHLAIAGSGSLEKGYETELRALAAELLGDRARFVGVRQDVADVLRASDLLVIASVLEGLPLSLLEAQACAIPTVGVPTAGIPEVLVDGRNGLLMDGVDVTTLAEALRRLADDDAVRHRLGTQARTDAETNSSLAGQADQIARITSAAARR